MSPSIHPTAIVDEAATLGADVSLGPYVVIDGPVTLGDGVVVGSHTALEGPLTIGARTRIGRHAQLGSPPQDKGYAGEPTRLEIGSDTFIGDGCNFSRGSTKDEQLTRVGDRCYIMAKVHIGHDCVIEDDVIIANSTGLSGHVHVGRGANVSGMVGVHQFCRIGRLAMVQGGSSLGQDCPPFAWVGGGRCRIQGLNRVGMRRAGIGREDAAEIKAAFKSLFRGGGSLPEALAALEASEPGELVRELIAFCREGKRGIMTWRA